MNGSAGSATHPLTTKQPKPTGTGATHGGNDMTSTDTATTDTIEFVDALPARRGGSGGAKGRGRMYRFVAALRENPGQWAIYKHDAKGGGVSVNRKNHPGTEWAARSNKTEDNPDDTTFTVFGRWVGENGEHGDQDAPAAKPVKKAAIKKAAARKTT